MFLRTFGLAASGFPPRHFSLLVSDKNVPYSSNSNLHLLDFCRLAMCPLLSHCQILFISHAGFRNCPRFSMLSIFNPSGSTEITSQNKSQLLPPCQHTHTHTPPRAQTHARTHAHAHTYIHKHTRTHTRARALTHTHTRARTRTHTRTHTPTHARARKHLHTRARANTYIHTHTRARAHAHTQYTYARARAHTYTHARERAHTLPDLRCHKTNILFVVSRNYGDFQFRVKIQNC